MKAAYRAGRGQPFALRCRESLAGIETWEGRHFGGSMPIDPTTVVNVVLAVAEPIAAAVKRRAAQAARTRRRVRAYNDIALGVVLGSSNRVFRGWAELRAIAEEVSGD